MRMMGGRLYLEKIRGMWGWILSAKSLDLAMRVGIGLVLYGTTIRVMRMLMMPRLYGDKNRGICLSTITLVLAVLV